MLYCAVLYYTVFGGKFKEFSSARKVCEVSPRGHGLNRSYKDR